jgi:hypothetical protein
MVRHFAEFVVLMSRFSLFNLIENRYLWGKRPFIPPARSGAGIWPPLQRRPPRRELTLANFPRTLTPMTSQAQGFQAPARFAAKLNGDEKRAAQTFLCHRLAAFNHDAGMLPENSTFEFRHRFPGGRAHFAVVVPVGAESSHDAH